MPFVSFEKLLPLYGAWAPINERSVRPTGRSALESVRWMMYHDEGRGCHDSCREKCADS